MKKMIEKISGGRIVDMREDRCVICGDIIPEGMMVCPNCKKNSEPNFSTEKIWIKLKQIPDITEFVNLASKCEDDVVVKSGNYAVNAKSLLGLVSLDLTKTLEVEFHGNIPCDVREDMKKFIIN